MKIAELVHPDGSEDIFEKAQCSRAQSRASQRWPSHSETPEGQRLEGVSEVSVRRRRHLQAVDLALYSPFPLRILAAGSSIGIMHTCASMEWEECALRAKNDFPNRTAMEV